MTATLRGLLAIALLAGLCLIPVALVFSALFFLAFLLNVFGGSQQAAFTDFIVVVGGLGLWSLLYMVFTTVGVTGTPRDASADISCDQAPDLWNRVTGLASRVGTRPPAEIRLTAQANAGVVEETRWLGLIPVVRRMYLGIPLLVALPPEQLDAVMCHELGHYARGHTRVGAVCYRARTAAELMVDRLSLIRGRTRRRGLVRELHFRLILGYTGIYRRLSTAAMQNQEFQADAKAAEIAGAEVTAAALHAVHAVAAGWRDFAEPEKVLLVLGGDAEDRFEGFRDKWRDSGFREDAAKAAALEVHDPFGTHPPLEERLARIIRGYAQATTAGAWPTPDAAPATTAPEIPLEAPERIRLFCDETQIRREREAGRAPVPAIPVPKGWEAILRMFRQMFKAHPAAAAMAAVIVLSGAGSGGFEGHQHARPLGPFIAAPASPTLPDLQIPPIQSVPAVSFPAISPSDYPAIQPSGFPSISGPVSVALIVTVQPGDTLTSLACRYHATVTGIQRLNHLGNSTSIWAGERLSIPVGGPSDSC